MPFPYICPYCKHAVQLGNPLPIGRPVKCPGCKKLYTAGAPGAVGTGPALAPVQNVVAAAPPPGDDSPQPPRNWIQTFLHKIGEMELKTMLASCVLLFLAGVVPMVFGVIEWSVGSTATSEPLAVDLAKLEKSPAPGNNHIKIGPHTAVYAATVYTITTNRKDRRRRPDANTKVDYCYYPIISGSHPYWQQRRRVQEKYGKIENVPEDELPDLADFRVLVKTSRFHKVGDLPEEDLRNDKSVQGLIINKILPIGAEDEALIRQNFPDIDFTKVLILSDGRQPSSGFFCFFLICLGLLFWFWLFALGGVWLYCRLFRRA